MLSASKQDVALKAVPTISPEALDDALSRIPPLWPLKHFVAVNPFAGLLHLPFSQACTLLQKATGAAPLLQPHEYLAAFDAGQITLEDVATAADATWNSERLLQWITSTPAAAKGQPILTVADFVDEFHPRARLKNFIVEEISKWCAVTYDDNQTTWNSPWKHLGPFAAWRQAAPHDRNPEAFGIKGFRDFIKTLPQDADACIATCLALLAPRQVSTQDFLHRQLASIAGWAGYVQYLVREDKLRGKSNPALHELLAIRLAYDAALWAVFVQGSERESDWRNVRGPVVDTHSIGALCRWQLAYEAGYQRNLARTLAAQPSHQLSERPTLQAVFCIDVRSEVFRRHLEAASAGSQTIGFAGFFGFPVHHNPVASEAGARCPVLLVPPVATHEALPAEQAQRHTQHKLQAGAWKAFSNSATSCFSFVETAGLGFAAALAARRKGAKARQGAPAFAADVPLTTRIGMAQGALRNMGLTQNFARLVLLCGHGSQSANNPYASALDCGACGGHAGDVNARLAASTLNNAQVRAGLASAGIAIPDDTVFIAGLHNTTTDNVILFDLEQVPASHNKDLLALQTSLQQAGMNARVERAPRLGLSHAADLEQAVQKQATDTSQVRPEWALANNAALIAAPRSRTSALNLQGRVFLHDYNASADTDNSVLTLILCAPVVVASWINLQYYASRVDPELYGSGNKVLHNVVGGVGVWEGNGGDLRVGLPLQSIHDGQRFVHEPRRLTVVIDVDHQRIDDVLAAQPQVRELFHNGWIHLIALEGAQALRYNQGSWALV
ncbi:MAG: DUF2309 domain-containing protein [Deltaproteobacteria bacterium]|nr:DUF2309 domain-containing protein [Deltaproteobacteria bacterium]